MAPRFKAAELPEKISEALGLSCTAPSINQTIDVSSANTREAILPPLVQFPVLRVRLNDALSAYFKAIGEKNADHHANNKLSILRQFIGTERTEQFVQNNTPEQSARRLKKTIKAFFTGEFVDEITPLLLLEFFQQLTVSTVTKRHYREFFHSFFDYCLKFGFYRADNWHCPNPVAALPSYQSKNHRIVYLTQENVDAQLKALLPHPDLYIAAAIMIYAGLRRDEALWLTRDAISPDFSYLSVVNRLDEDGDIESTLKTGERSVSIIPQLRPILEQYLSTLQGRWLVPMEKGGRWDGNAFGRKLRRINTERGLDWSSMHYRHTYATQRAAQGWSLLRISHEMGNSVAIVTKYYAAYMRPVEMGVQQVGNISRFKTPGDFASYCRTVDSNRVSNGKQKGSNNQKCGNKYLAWAFVEGANFAKQHHEACRRWADRKAAKSGKIVPTKALACKLAKAAWHVMSTGNDYDETRMFPQLAGTKLSGEQSSATIGVGP